LPNVASQLKHESISLESCDGKIFSSITFFETPCVLAVVDLCRTILVANNIQLLKKDTSPMFTGQDVSKIRKFSRQKNVVCFVLCCCHCNIVNTWANGTGKNAGFQSV